MPAARYRSSHPEDVGIECAVDLGRPTVPGREAEVMRTAVPTSASYTDRPGNPEPREQRPGIAGSR